MQEVSRRMSPTMAELFLPFATDLVDQVVSGKAGDLDEPDNLLRSLVNQTQLLASLHWLTKSQVLACIPPDEAVPFQDVAEMACVSVSELSRIVRFTAISGFLCEPRTNSVAHTCLSRKFLLKTALPDAVLFLGDTVFNTTLYTPRTMQLQGQESHGRNATFAHPGMAFQLDGGHPPRLKRRATAFQRQVLQQALSSESATADLLEPWMASAFPDNSTVVQVCCESDTIARAIARRHPQLSFVIQLTTKTEPACEGGDYSANMGHFAILQCGPMSAQPITDAWLYIIHLPTPSFLPMSADILSHASHMLWIHFDILRQNRYSTLVIVANALVGSAKEDSKAEAAARMYDLLLMQMTADKHAITMDQMEQLLSNIRDASWRLVIWRKEISSSHPTVAFEVGLAAV